MPVLNKSDRRKTINEDSYETPTYCVNFQGNATAFLIFSNNNKKLLLGRDPEWSQ